VGQQLQSDGIDAIVKNAEAASVKKWTSIKSARQPIFPREGLKLRNVDIFIIDDRCKGCSFCIEFCPRKVLEQGKKLNKIGVHPPQTKDTSLCVGCGVCEDICPDFALFLVDRGELR
jgi:2-oxoglutarate ferredoxin oxidoreductase subunit delta